MSKTNPNNLIALIALIVAVVAVVMSLVIGRPLTINASDGSNVNYFPSTEIEVSLPRSARHDPPAAYRPKRKRTK